MGETRRKGRGYGIAARVQEGGPVTWETSYLHLENRWKRRPGDQASGSVWVVCAPTPG